MTTPDELPGGLHHVRTTDVFDAQTVPDGLLRSHRVARAVWGRLVVHDAQVDLVFEEDDRRVTVSAGEYAIIPPVTPHHVELADGARFAVEFHRAPPEVT